MGGTKSKNAEASPDDASPGDDAGILKKNPWLKGLLLVFCCCHAVFLCISIIPGSHFGNPAMELYRLVVGGQQQWNMFSTIPVQHSMDLHFEGENEEGDKMTAGCVLPGLMPYPKPEESRYYVLFHQMMFIPKNVAYRDAYLRKAAQLLPAQPGPGAGRNWLLVVDTEYTRNLYHSRRDGHLSMPVTKTFDLNHPGENPP
jgi:hypothetical protein